ncbi:MAG TPA: TIGR02466 family protein [Rhizomicrobium sp.]|nr:TIGR02466 family protein [Rhizomicrobium sp.]
MSTSPRTGVVDARAQSSAQAFDLFATRIWQARVPQLGARIPEWIATILDLRAASPVPAGRTNRGGWNSTGHTLLEQPVFADLRTAVATHCLAVLNELGLASPSFVLQSWANVHDRGGFNFLHIHEGCLLSGTFYLQVPDGAGNLVFRDPRPGVINSYAKGSSPNAYKDVQLRPEAGLMVLFPHWLEHFVEVHQSDTPRICIPFNAVKA